MAAEPEQDVAPAADHTSVVILPQRVVVGDARLGALLRIERRKQLASERIQRLQMSARPRRQQLIPADQSKSSEDAGLRADPERRTAIHGRRQEAVQRLEAIRIALNVD